MEVSFKGKFICGAEVYKRSFFNRKKYNPQEVSFVKLDAFDDKDYKLMRNLSKSWGYSYAKSIEKFARITSLKYIAYVLTKQKSDFENLEPKKVLGIVQGWSYKNNTHIEYLQVNPKFAKQENAPRGKYKSIGTAILDCYKNFKKTQTITLTSDKRAKKFYEKQGFVVEHELYPNSYIWQKPEHK